MRGKPLILIFIFLLACKENPRFKHPESLEKPVVNFYASDFYLPDSSGVYRSLYQHLSKANILDFWASWCRPCRESANPYYKKLYKTYHKKGLNIFGVSGDRHQYFWKKALKQDSIPWINTIDSLHTTYTKFQVKSLPKMFLIDKNAKIIGINLWGKELENKIDSLLKIQN